MDLKFLSLNYEGKCSCTVIWNLGDQCTDTILRIDPLGFSVPHLPTSKGIKRKWSSINGCLGHCVNSSLCLGLSRSSSSSDSEGSLATACTAMSSAKETEEESSMDLDLEFTLHLENEKSKTPVPKSMFDLELSLPMGCSESEITSSHQNGIIVGTHFLDDESASSHSKAENLSQFYSPWKMEGNLFFDPFSSIATVPKSSVTCTSGIINQQLPPQPQQWQHGSSVKMCQFTGCGKGARGASGLFIAHGGGRRCHKPGCHKGAESPTAFCKAHGGGWWCEFLSCMKSAEGQMDFCISPGEGRWCSHEGCTRAARGKSGLCIRHGGGRCHRENCTRSAEGLSGLFSHGGSCRCWYPLCTKGAQGSMVFCKAHGSGEWCINEACTKGVEGSTPFCKGHDGGKRCSFSGCMKSVHGGISFCVAPGNCRRCSMPECTKRARGRSEFCVRHSGNKQCKFHVCGKTAQSSTDFCKVHGGGKMCSWGQPGSRFGNQDDDPCGSFSQGKMGLCSMHGALIQDKRVHGGVTLGLLVENQNSSKPDNMKDLVCDDVNPWTIKIGTSATIIQELTGFPSAVNSPSSCPVAEGQVHGGSLMAMLKGGPRPVSVIVGGLVGGPYELTDPHVGPLSWM